MSVKHGRPLKVAGSVSGNGPDPSESRTLLRQSTSLPGGAARYGSLDFWSARTTLLYKASCGLVAPHSNIPTLPGTDPENTPSIGNSPCTTTCFVPTRIPAS